MRGLTQCIDHDVETLSDYACLVNCCYTRRPSAAAEGKLRHGGLSRFLASSATRSLIRSVTRVKTHVAVNASLPRNARGNSEADAVAKRAGRRHPEWCPDVRAALDDGISDVTPPCRVAAAVLPLWSKSERYPRIPAAGGAGASGIRRGADGAQHAWFPGSKGGWRCSKCLAMSRRGASQAKRWSSTCPG